jgi:hypothetical protein
MPACPLPGPDLEESAHARMGSYLTQFRPGAGTLVEVLQANAPAQSARPDLTSMSGIDEVRWRWVLDFVRPVSRCGHQAGRLCQLCSRRCLGQRASLLWLDEDDVADLSFDAQSAGPIRCQP